MEFFRRKARLVAGGHVTEPAATITYVSVVFIETVCIAIIIPALNYVQVSTADIHNTYTQAPVAEAINIFLGPEVGMDYGKPDIIVRILVWDQACWSYFLEPFGLLHETYGVYVMSIGSKVIDEANYETE